jgi:hypothetical protein
MASQFNVNALGAYSNEQSKELFAKMFLGFETLDSGKIRVVDTVKESIKLKYIDNTLTLQAGGCGFNASGAVALSDKTFTAKKLKVDTELCEEDLDGTSFELFLNPGSNNGMEADLLNQITNLFTIQLQNTIEDKFWNGGTGATEFQGVIAKANADSDVVDYSFTWNASGNTATSYINAVHGIYNALPAVAQKDAVLFVGYDVFNKIAQAFITGLNYNIGFNADTMVIPGTTMKIARVNGLTGKNVALATVNNNLTYVTDTVAETKSARVWYSMDDQIVKVHIPFRAGADYFFGEYIVLAQ